ncbi:MAG: formylglycine-generating enzyme family protein [Magnetococcales bacterium]|nr:formylglycine-generating enzyme family protein [Magnetococcales bacterium]
MLRLASPSAPSVRRKTAGSSRHGLVALLLLPLLALAATAEAFLIKEWDELSTTVTTPGGAVDIQAGKPWREPLSGISFVWVPGGCYKMGSPPNAEGRDADEEPMHNVCLSGFWLGEREVTQQQWQRVLLHNPSQLHHEVMGQKDEAFPVEHITRMDVEEYLAKLNTHHQGSVNFALPTEAQWEYACRNGGEKVVYPGYAQVDQLAWYRHNSNNSTQMTGSRLPNRLGLYDMGGNVWEWVRDSYDKNAYGQHGSNDPLVSSDTPFSVIRGGGWKDGSEGIRCANRGFERFGHKRPDLGLRLAASVDVKPVETKGTKRVARPKMPF